MCITRLHNFCINEGCVGMVSSDDNLENEIGYIPSDIRKTSIAGNSVLRDIIVQELMQRDLERPTFNVNFSIHLSGHDKIRRSLTSGFLT